MIRSLWSFMSFHPSFPHYGLNQKPRWFLSGIYLSPPRAGLHLRKIMAEESGKSSFLSSWNYLLPCTPQEKAMAPHSSTLAWKIPWTEEPGRLQSVGSLRVGHDWATSLSLFTFMHWRRKRQPTPVFLPGESQGRGSLVGCCLWGLTESDTTKAT